MSIEQIIFFGWLTLGIIAFICGVKYFFPKETCREKYYKLLRDYSLLGIEFNRSEELIKVLRRLSDEKDREIHKLKNP
jgi:hypothetical protein